MGIDIQKKRYNEESQQQLCYGQLTSSNFTQEVALQGNKQHACVETNQ